MAEFGFTDQFRKKFPEIDALIKQATEGQWEMDKFLDSLKATKWWKSSSDSSRRFDVSETDNPGEVADQVRQMSGVIHRLATQMGFNSSSANAAAAKLARNAVKLGWSEDEIRIYVGAMYTKGASEGLIGKTHADLKELAGNYAVKVSDATLRAFTKAVLQGVRSPEDYETFFRDRAKQQYSAIAAELDQGYTVRQVLDPYLQHAAEELGVNPATLDITNGKWNAAIQYRPKGETAPRAMTNDEWTAKLRTDANYGWDGTQNAQKAASALAMELGRSFGAFGG